MRLRHLLAAAVPCWLACHGATGRHDAFASVSDMVVVPTGTLITGTDSVEVPHLLERYHTRHAEIFAGEFPKRTVRVNAFSIDRSDVTKMQFREFLIATPSWQKEAVPASAHNGRYLEDWLATTYPAGAGARPMAFATWAAAAAYCSWCGKRLPTEVEWERAALGGLSLAEFPWGDADPDATHANWSGTKLGHSSDVAQFAPNGYGLYDMAGNVWQFVADPWPIDNRTLSPAARAEGPGTRYVIKGGSFEGAAVNLRVRYRDSHPGGGAGPHVGFRCARSD